MHPRSVRVALAALGLALLAACGSTPPAPPPPAGTPLDVQTVREAGPRVPNGSVFAASDLTTLRSLVDASDAALVGQLGGTVARHQCMPPYTADGGPCWPDVTSQPDRAYLALEAEAGFCTTMGAPRVAVSGAQVELQLPFTVQPGCHINGSLAAPSASLFWFPTDRLKPGLYQVAYVLQSATDTYRSDSTYLSVPGPPAGLPAGMDQEATAALTSVIGSRRSGLFSLSRVDGSQLGGLCGQTVAGPAYLVTYEADLGASPRHMTVALAGPSPRTCATTRI